MLKLIHTADVHLGARHDDLGEQAAAQRERQFAAFRATVDLAIAEKVDLVLIAGDLFDSNVQPRRSVERVAAELKRLAEARDPDGHHPGHPRRLRPGIDLSRLRPRRSGRQRPRRRHGHGPRPGASVGPLARLRRDRRGPGVRHEARPAQPAPGHRSPPTMPDGRLARRHGPRLDRDPGPDGPRRGRRHDRGDRGERARLPRPGPLALGAEGQGRAPSPTPTRAPRKPSPSTRTGPARSFSSSSTRSARQSAP